MYGGGCSHAFRLRMCVVWAAGLLSCARAAGVVDPADVVDPAALCIIARKQANTDNSTCGKAPNNRMPCNENYIDAAGDPVPRAFTAGCKMCCACDSSKGLMVDDSASSLTFKKCICFNPTWRQGGEEYTPVVLEKESNRTVKVTQQVLTSCGIPADALTSQCNAGYSGTGNICEECSPGKFAGSTGFKICTNCNKGQYAVGLGSTECTDCQPGNHAEEFGSTQCTSCQPGSYAASSGMPLCLACLDGQYQNRSGSIACRTDCPANYFIPDDKRDCRAQAGEPVAVARVEGTILKSGPSPLIIVSSDKDTERFGTKALFDASNVLIRVNGSACDPPPIWLSRKSIFCLLKNASVLASKAPEGTFIMTITREGGLTTTHQIQVQRQCLKGEISRGSGCEKCEKGKYQPDLDQQNCKDCPLGTVTLLPGSVNESDCECAIGKERWDDNRDRSCQCPPGKCDMTTTHGCHNCSVGHYSQEQGLSCGAAAVCMVCPARSRTTVEGATAVAQCECVDKNMVKSESGGSCGCPKGWRRIDAADICEGCRLNQYSDVIDATECKPCGKGMLTLATKSVLKSSCVCEPGKIMSAEGDACVCPPGTKAVKEGERTRCEECASGFYNDHEDQARCIRCPAGKSTTALGSKVALSDCSCAEGFANASIYNAGELDTCIDCSNATVFRRGGVLCMNGRVFLKEGFWRPSSGIISLSNVTLVPSAVPEFDVYACKYSRCRGSWCVPATNASDSSDSSDNSGSMLCNTTDECFPGMTGVLCSQCVEGMDGPSCRIQPS